MAVILPDIIGEYVDLPERLETDGIQYAGYFEPAQIAPEQVTHLFLFLQNTLDAPMVVNLKTNIPQTGGLFRSGRPILEVQEPIIQIKLAGAEAGLLTLPVATTEHVKEGQHALVIEIKTAFQDKPDRVRAATSQSKLSQKLIDSPVGLNLVGTLGATYTEKSVKKAPFYLEVAGEPAPPERAPRLEHKYQTIWVQDYLEVFNQAIHELNLREVKFKKELTMEALYTNLYAESTTRFADAGLPLRIGEAITLTKILTYCCQYFLTSADRRNGLLVPIWERAIEAGIDTTDVLEVIRTAGYYHVLKLATALGFGLVARAIGKHAWPLVERQAVTNHIAESIEAGEGLDVDFLYLPLLMAGTFVSHKLKMDGENPQQSLALMKKAYEARPYLFTEADMAQANKIYNHILKKAIKQG